MCSQIAKSYYIIDIIMIGKYMHCNTSCLCVACLHVRSSVDQYGAITVPSIQKLSGIRSRSCLCGKTSSNTCRTCSSPAVMTSTVLREMMAQTGHGGSGRVWHYEVPSSEGFTAMTCHRLWRQHCKLTSCNEMRKRAGKSVIETHQTESFIVG